MTKNNEETAIYVNDIGSFFAGAIFGGLAGAGAMLLLAPQSGQRTREQLEIKGTELRDQAAEVIEAGMAQTRVKARQMTHDVREKAKELQHNGEGVMADQSARLAAAISAGKTAIHN